MDRFFFAVIIAVEKNKKALKRMNSYEWAYFKDHYLPVILIIVAVAGIGLGIWLIVVAIKKYQRYITRKYEDLVFRNSKRYKAIVYLNSTYDFHENLAEQYNLYWNVNSKAQFDRFNFRQNFKQEIACNYDHFLSLLNMADDNYKKYIRYKNDVAFLPDFTDDNAEFLKGMDHKKYSSFEHSICDRGLLTPITFFVFRCNLEYTSPAGRNSYSEYKVYDCDQIDELLAEISEDDKKKETAAYQRSIMTPTMRYDVMKRDGFRCVLCGRTADDGVKLHVDHIIPVSKGGKTVMKNLRTLCEDCNLGKSDKYDEYGLN